jgi:hypothetical protein
MDYLKIYNHVLGKNHSLKPTGKNAKGECFLCGKNALSIDVSSGKGQCLACEESMNAVGFITKYHNAWFEKTPDDKYAELQEARGLRVSAFKKVKFAFDANNNRWLVPYKNPSTAFLNNLGNFRTSGENAYKVFVLPNEGGMFPKGFYNPFTFKAKPANKKVKVLIGEGEWDTVAFVQMLGMLEPEEAENYTLLGSAGAKIIPKDAVNMLRNYENIILCYDNDEPGQEGTGKMATFLITEGFKVEFLNWESAASALSRNLDGFDVRDIVTKCKKGFGFISKHFSPLELDVPVKNTEELGPGFIHTVEGIEPVDTCEHYMDLYKKEMVLTKNNEKAVKFTMAVAASAGLPGLPVWSFLVGRASGGKTTLIESYGGEHEWCNYASKLTAKSLISGAQGSDKSYIQFINGKPFFIKDYTVILEMGANDQKELLAILRDLYDGSIKITYGTGKVEKYQNINFPIIAGVTYDIQKVQNTQLGERFLRFNYTDENVSNENDYDEFVYDVMDSMLANFGRQNDKKDNLTKATIGYLKTVKENYWDVSALPELGKSWRTTITDLAMYTAHLRTNPQNHKTEGLLYRPKAEDPYRLGLQFTKIGFSLAKVLEPTKNHGSTLNLNDETVDIIMKTAMDTCYGFGQDVVKFLHDNPKSCHSDIARLAKIQDTRCHRVLIDLKTVGIVNTVTRTSGRGRPTLLYKLSDRFQSLTDKMFNNES